MKLFFILASLTSSFAHAGDYSTPYGTWRGQAQYQAMIKSISDPAAHIVTNLTIDIDPQGKVIGTSTENGCKLLGIASPSVAPYILSLNITLTNCNYSGYNRTYNGQLGVIAKDNYAKFTLQAIDMASGKAGNYTISATMRR